MIDPVQCWKAVCQERAKPLYTHSEFLEMEAKVYASAQKGNLEVYLIKIAPQQTDLRMVTKKVESIESHFRAKGFYVYQGIIHFGKNLDGVVEAGEYG
jgi:hypothetical protein